MDRPVPAGSRPRTAGWSCLEAEVCGFGASGRNGGPVLGAVPPSLDQLCGAGRPGRGDRPAPRHDRHRRGGRTRGRAVGHRPPLGRGGTVTVATNPVHVGRIRSYVDERHRWGFGEADDRWLSPTEMVERSAWWAAAGGGYTAGAGAPACLVRGLARCGAGRRDGPRRHPGDRDRNRSGHHRRRSGQGRHRPGLHRGLAPPGCRVRSGGCCRSTR